MIPDTTINPPFSEEAEQSVLGSLLVNPPAFWQVSQQLTPDDFFLTRHSKIFAAMRQVMERYNTMDFLIVVEELKSMGELQNTGGLQYLVELNANTPTSVHVEIYAGLVAIAAVRRKMLVASDTMRAMALDENINVQTAINGAEAGFIELARHRETSHRISMKDAMETTDAILHERIKLYQKNPDYVIGVCSGVRELDKHLDGFQPGITTMAGSTGMGKTACAMTVALNASKIGNQHEEPLPSNVHLFSGEMTQTQMNFRLLSMKSGIPAERLMRGEMNSTTYNQYQQAKYELDDLHALTFESGKQLNVTEIRNRVRELVNSQQLDLFILDGLMQINGLEINPNDKGRFKRYQEQKRRDAIEYVLNELEYIAMTYKIPFLVTHQVNRAPKDRGDKRPMLSDMAEASFVEWKSSVVLGVYRDSYYNKEVNPRPDGIQEAEIIILKNRHGSPGTVRCIYESRKTLFADGVFGHADLTKDE